MPFGIAMSRGLIRQIGNQPRAFPRAIDEPRTLPLSPPKSGTKRDFAVFDSKIQVLLKNVCYNVSLYENFQKQSCSYIIPLSKLKVYRQIAGDVPSTSNLHSK